MENNLYFKQMNLFNPVDTQLKIFIYGVGSIGSHLVMGLCKTGFNKITVFDFDKLSIDNLPAQFYSKQILDGCIECDEGVEVNDSNTQELKNSLNSKNSLLKVNQIQKNVEFMAGTEIESINKKITSSFTPNLEFNSIHIVCFDNIESREIIFNKLKGFPVHFIDGRIGGFNFEKYYIDMSKDDNINNYNNSLKGEFSDLECGSKTLWGVNSLLSAKIIADVIKITKSITPIYAIKSSLLSDIVIINEGSESNDSNTQTLNNSTHSIRGIN